MPDLKNVTKALREISDYFFNMYRLSTESYETAKAKDRCDAIEDAIALLKEREAVKPVLDEQTGRIWLCGKCGSYVGFEDNDPHDPNEFDKYCRECGRPVLWEGLVKLE